MDISHFRGAFDEFLTSHPLADAEQVTGDGLPSALANRGVLSVYRNGKYVYFVTRSDSFLGDRWTEEFIRQVEPDERPIETILSTTKRRTFHIQELFSARGWYFWFHD